MQQSDRVHCRGPVTPAHVQHLGWSARARSHGRSRPVSAKRLILALAVLGGLVAAAGQASNTGFQLVTPLRAHPGDLTTNLISLPYFYFPNGDIGSVQRAHDLVPRLPAVTSLARVSPESGLVESWDYLDGTWMGVDFTLEAAVGVSVSVLADGQAVLVGSSNDAFAGLVLRPAAGAPTSYLVAPPYHTRWGTADDLLAATFDGVNQLSVATYRAGRTLKRTIYVGPVYSGEPFDLVAGEALDLTVIADTVFHSSHYRPAPLPRPRRAGRILIGVTTFIDLHHSEGGRVMAAADGTSADGAGWRAASVIDQGTVVTSGYPGQGEVGAVEPGFWYGEVGDGLARASGGDYQVAIGDDRLVLIDREVDDLDAGRRGYYAVTSKNITAERPDLFPAMTLRPIPVPTARPCRGAIWLSWPAAEEDPAAPSRDNLIGYEVYRSADGSVFEPIGVTSAESLRFVDVGDGVRQGSFVYALRLLYRFGLRSQFLSGASGRTLLPREVGGLEPSGPDPGDALGAPTRSARSPSFSGGTQP